MGRLDFCCRCTKFVQNGCLHRPLYRRDARKMGR
jgi:hypothetical protein